MNDTSKSPKSRYAEAGVTSDLEQQGLPKLLDFVRQTFTLREGWGRPLTDVGYYANVIDLPGEHGLAVATDGVGTKILIAEMMERYDTVAHDAMAMNVNDLICVGAEPISFMNYLGIDRNDPQMLSEIGRGLLEAATLANVTIPGGETAQVGALLGGVPGKAHFDLVGMAMGLVPKDKLLLGQDIADGDVLIGVASSGLHSNGYSLARKALLEEAGLKLEDIPAGLDEPLGEALLRPTLIYVKPVVELLKSQVALKAVNHITGGGFLNLLRVDKQVSFTLDNLPGGDGDAPPLPPIIPFVQKTGQVSNAEMHEVFNMGVGLVVTAAPEAAEKVQQVFSAHGFASWRLGSVSLSDRPSEVRLPQRGLVGREEGFLKA